MANLTYGESIVVADSPAGVYDLVADVTRGGTTLTESSPTRTRAAHDGIPATLASIKGVAESA